MASHIERRQILGRFGGAAGAAGATRAQEAATPGRDTSYPMVSRSVGSARWGLLPRLELRVD
jgi:hypothetical protein